MRQGDARHRLFGDVSPFHSIPFHRQASLFSLSIDEQSGPFALACLLCLVGCLVIWVGLWIGFVERSFLFFSVGRTSKVWFDPAGIIYVLGSQPPFVEQMNFRAACVGI